MFHLKNLHRALYSISVIVIYFLLQASAANAATLNAPHLQTPIQIDGKLDEAAWQKALVCTPFNYLQSRQLNHPPAATEARLLVDDNAVYIGIRCAEPEMAKLKDAPMPRDSEIWGQDCVEVFLSPSGRQSSLYHFMVGASGAQFDNYLMENGTLEGPPYNGVWQSAVYKGADYWSAEIRVPLSAFPFTDSSQFSSTWLVNVARERKPVVEFTSWAPVYQSFSETQKYFQVSGMPRKSAALDLQIAGVKPVIEAADGSGAILLQIDAAKTAAGKYHYQIKNAESGALIKTGSIHIPAGKNTLRLDDVHFPSLGKSTFQIALQNAAGQIAAWTYATSDLIFQPLQINVTAPFYAGCIFPDQHINQITGSAAIHLLPDQLRGAVLLTSLNDASGKMLITTKSTLDARAITAPVAFALKAAALPVGDYTLQVQVQKNNQILTTASTSIRKLAPTTGSSVRIDRHLNLVVNGTPIFPRTWMGDENFLLSKTLRDEMHHPDPFVNLWHVQVNADPWRLDPADKERSKQDVMPSQKVFDGLRQRYEKNRNRKDGWVYYLADEPDLRGISLVYLKYCYDYIKKMDPYHPVLIVAPAPQDFVSVADIVAPDSYINPQVIDGKRRLGRAIRVAGQNIKLALAAGDGKTAAWNMPQAFNYGGPLDGRPNSDNPNFAEFRCSVYDSITYGAKGIIPFLYSLHFASWDLRYGVDFVNESLAHLEPFLVAPQEPMPLKVQSTDNSVDVWAKNVDGKVLLIAVNTSDKPASAEISGAGLEKFSHLEGYRETLSAPVKAGALTLSFTPYQVHLLTSEKMDAGLSSVSGVLQKIAIANANRQKPGNILYGRGKEIQWTASDHYMATNSLWTLTDGITDDLGWQDVLRKAPAEIEMAFPTFTPRFNEAKIYSSTIQDLDFYIWNAGKWQLAGQVKNAKGSVIDLHFNRELSTKKIKIAIPKSLSSEKAELNEIELYDNK